MENKPKTNEEIIRQTGTLILDNNPLSIASYLEEKEITRKESTINTMLNEARASQKAEDLKTLERVLSEDNPYSLNSLNGETWNEGVQHAIALLEKMI